jgi:hypothetical protein
VKKLLAALVCAGALNLALAALGLTARSPYKPMLWLEGAMVVLFLAVKGPVEERLEAAGGIWFAALLGVAVAAAYGQSFFVDFQHHDWTHRHISASLTSAAAFAHLFTTRQADGMYRPLGFVSYWVDYRIFGPKLWGYHIQSVLLHAVNALLLAKVAIRLGFARGTAWTAAALFGLGAIEFEAVLWPAARFDLLAACFVMLALLCFLNYWDTARLGWLAATLAAFTAAALNKETGYAFVLIAAALLFTHRMWGRERMRATLFAVSLTVLTAGLIAVRYCVYGDLGGYATVDLAITWKSVYSLLVNALTLSMFGINTSVDGSWMECAILLAFAAVMTAAAVLYRGGQRGRMLALALLCVLSAAPAVNVIGWIRPSLLHSRHVYLAGLWMSLLVAAALAQCGKRQLVTFAWIAVNIAALNYNLWVQRDMFQRAESIAERVAWDWEREGHPAVIQVTGAPDDANGAFYFGDELRRRIEEQTAGAKVPGLRPLSYAWDERQRTLVRR